MNPTKVLRVEVLPNRECDLVWTSSVRSRASEIRLEQVSAVKIDLAAFDPCEMSENLYNTMIVRE